MTHTQLPPIAEKIKFWEEQDKINEALIPRVIAMGETLSKISIDFQGFSSRISGSEVKIRNYTTQHTLQQENALNVLRSKLSQIDKQISAALEKQNDQSTTLADLKALHAENSNRISFVEQQAKEIVRLLEKMQNLSPSELTPLPNNMAKSSTKSHPINDVAPIVLSTIALISSAIALWL